MIPHRRLCQQLLQTLPNATEYSAQRIQTLNKPNSICICIFCNILHTLPLYYKIRVTRRILFTFHLIVFQARKWTPNEATSAAAANFVAGATASLVTQSVVVPIDVISQRLMVAGDPPTLGPVISCGDTQPNQGGYPAAASHGPKCRS